MEKPKFRGADRRGTSILESSREKEILKNFSPEEAKIIKDRKSVLSALGYFIGKNFSMPIVLGLPSESNPSGWHWGKANGESYIQINAKDLLEKPMDYLRYLISHEGGHERVSRVGFIPPEEWKQPGFALMMNSIEDPRMNNFVAEAYPPIRGLMHKVYKEEFGSEKKGEELAKQTLGFQPLHAQASSEYIKQWMRQEKGRDFKIDGGLPKEVKDVVRKTLSSAARSWRLFPTKDMADGKEYDELGSTGEESIVQHARASYEVNKNEIWPEFRKLIAQDIEDQKIQETIQDMKNQKGHGQEQAEEQEQQQGQGGGQGQQQEQEQQQGQGGEGQQQEQGGACAGGQSPSIPQKLKDNLSSEEQRDLENAINNSLGQSGEEGQGESKNITPVPLDSLSEELKQKIREYIESLPEGERREIEERARQAIKEFNDALNKELEGKLTKNPEEIEAEQKEQQAQAQETQEQAEEQEQQQGQGGVQGQQQGQGQEQQEQQEQVQIYDDTEGEPSENNAANQEPEKHTTRRWREHFRQDFHEDMNAYREYRQNLLALINKTKNDFKRILIPQKSTWQEGHKVGGRINIGRRIQEKAKGISVVESKAWQRREHPKKNRYAISLLVDLSGSMWGRSIEETFKSVIVLVNVLNSLGINTEVLGFNDELSEYQNFGQPMSEEVREKISGMIQAADGGTNVYRATDIALERLSKQREEQKMLITLSDVELSELQDLVEEKEKTLKNTNITHIDIGTVDGKTVGEIIENIKKLIEKEKTT